ncbi:MAG: LacI family transcriptional regulator [Gorillibacterium sp.]|nr:LacI family transcriptional regulator [Gorillibacterium sp.]
MRKRVTSTDVAKRAGVSRSLVSAFLNGTPGITVSEDNRAAITNAINEMKYTVNVQAKSIKTGRSHCIAVYGDVYNALLLQLVEGIQQASGPAGYHVLMYGEGGNQAGRDGLIALYRQGRIDGLITLDFPDSLSAQWERAVLECGVPYVTVEGIPEGGICTVQTDYGGSITQALDFMWEETGVPPIYLNVQPPDRPATQGDRERLQAYEAWMSNKGLVHTIVTTIDEPWATQKNKWQKWLEGQQKPLSVLANWSRGAVSLYRIAYEQGWRVGSDLFVMSADDTERVSRHMVPPIPCIEVPYMDMGRQAFMLLEERMEVLAAPEAVGQQTDVEADAQEQLSGPKWSNNVRQEVIKCKLFKGLE